MTDVVVADAVTINQTSDTSEEYCASVVSDIAQAFLMEFMPYRC